MTDSTQTAPAESASTGERPVAEATPAGPPTTPALPDPASDPRSAIATWTEPATTADRLAPISSRTGEPVRAWSIWLAAAASYVATAVIGAATLGVYWVAATTGSMTTDPATGDITFTIDDSRFAHASWLMSQFQTEPGSLGRVLLAVAVTVVALLIGTASAITGYYAYDGRRWTRWSGLAALALSPLSLLLNAWAWPVMGLTAVAAIAVWLPPSIRYFAAWQALRRRDPVFSEAPTQVNYGPLPKYR